MVQRRLAYQELKKMEEAEEKEPFLRKVCQWLGQPDLSIEDHWCYDDTKAYRRQLYEFLKSCVDRELTSKEEKEEFAAKLKELRY